MALLRVSSMGMKPNRSASAEESAQERGQETCSKENCKVDKTVVHKVEDYYHLPQGAYYMVRDGERDISYYRVIEHIKAQNIEHIYEVARVHLPDGNLRTQWMTLWGNLEDLPELLAHVLSWKICLPFVSQQNQEDAQIKVSTSVKAHSTDISRTACPGSNNS